MAFASIFVPDFLVQAVVRADPALRGRAVALLEGAPPLTKVVAANEAALHTGVFPGMMKSNAEHFSGVALRPRSPQQEAITHTALLDVCWSVSPRIEDTASDTVTLSLEGLESLFGSQEAVARRLVQRAAECGLAIRVAVAANIEVALVAVRGFAGITVVPPGAENEILRGLPVQALSPPPETLEILHRWGVHTCGALAALPLLDLSERLGQAGVRLHARACGTFTRELVVAEPVHHFEEQWELDEAVEDLDALSFCLGRLLDQVCARLAARSLALASLRISFELQPAFDKAFDAAREAFRQKSEPGFYRTVLQIPFATRDSKMLLKLLRLRLQAQPPSTAITKIFLSAESGSAPVTQNSLFLPIAPEPDKLELTLARIRGIVGEANAGSAMLADSHRHGAFRMVPFAAASFRPAAHSHSAPVIVEPSESLKTPAMFRMFRPPLPATVHLQEEKPSRIVFQGKRGMVLAASGPWRSSGDWWNESHWQHDEWDLEICFPSLAQKNHGGNVPGEERGLYRIFFDVLRNAWFVRGFYD